MRTPLLLCLAVSALLADRVPGAAKAVNGPSAFDKAQLESYVRHLFVWPAPDIKIEIGDPKPSPIAGFEEINVHASNGQGSQDEKFYVSKNGRQVLQASLYDITANPFHDNLTKLKTEDRPGFGAAGAPVVMVEFSDFQCHFCKEEAKAIRDNLLKDYPTEVRFYFADYPLDQMHPWARSAAIAGRCVFHQNAAEFWKFHDWVFDNQEQMSVDTLQPKLLEWAKTEGLNPEILTACMDGKAAAAEVAASVAMGKAVNIGSTPTTFVNGRPMVGATPWPELKHVIDFEIGYQRIARNAGENCGCDLTLPKAGVR